MAKHYLTQPYSASGEWNLPETPDSKIAGVVSWSDRANLELNDTFTPIKTGAYHGDEFNSYPVIHGITAGSELVTILDATASALSFNFGRGGFRQPQKLRSSWMLLGAHVLPDAVYRSIDFQLPGLQIWLSRSGIQKSFEPGRFSLEVTGLPEETFYVPAIKATLGWLINHNFDSDATRDVSIRTTGFLRIRPDEPSTLDWFFEQLNKATTLLSFLGGTPISPDFITATTEDGNPVDVMVALRASDQCILAHPQNLHPNQSYTLRWLRAPLPHSYHRASAPAAAQSETAPASSQPALCDVTRNEQLLRMIRNKCQ